MIRISQNMASLRKALTVGMDVEGGIEGARKILFGYIILGIGFLTLVVLGLSAIRDRNTVHGLFDLFVALFLLLIFLYHRRTGRTPASALVGLLFIGLLLAAVFVTGGVGNSGPIWLCTYPALSMFLLGARTGTILSLALLLCAMGLQVGLGHLEGVADYGLHFHLRFFLAYMVITLCAFFYEVVRSAIQGGLGAKKAELEEKVAELRATEEALRGSREELERRVEERTAALQKAIEYLQQQIAERERVERALLDSHERFVTVLEGIAADVYVADIRSYEILFVNRHMRDSIGNEALAGQPCFRAFRGLDSPCPECTKHQLLNPDGRAAGLFTWEALNPITGRWFVYHARAVAWDRNRMVRLQIATDITDRKMSEEAMQKVNLDLERRVRERTENIARINEALRKEIRQREGAQDEAMRAKEAAERANRTKSEFLANMSHELRTPLNHIIGFTELVADKKVGDLNSEQQEYLYDVLMSSRHLLSLINDVLDLSKVEAGKMVLDPTLVNVQALLESSLTMVKEKAIKHGIRLEADYGSIPELVRVDERKLKQVMYNLLSNAVKFTPDGGTIRVEARRSDETAHPCGNAAVPDLRDQAQGPFLGGRRTHLKIAVSDTGIGIGEKDLERIFAPFEQVDNSATKAYKGTGLGLSVSRNFVELHGGRIWAESGGSGKGSAFVFTIPVEVEEDLLAGSHPKAVVNAARL